VALNLSGVAATGPKWHLDVPGRLKGNLTICIVCSTLGPSRTLSISMVLDFEWNQWIVPVGCSVLAIFTEIGIYYILRKLYTTQNVLWSVGHTCPCVCLSAAACPHYCTDPDVTWGSDRGCPLVVHYSADLQSVQGLRCCGNITRTLVTSLRPSHDMTT